MLKKKNLLHEIEDSIVTPCPVFSGYIPGMRVAAQQSLTFVVASGKGVLSEIFPYLLKNDDRVKGILVLDKAQILDWKHISEANNDVKRDGRPMIQMWETFNLHTS